MKRIWSDSELREHWTLSVEELSLMENKIASNRLGLALQLKNFQLLARFAQREDEFPAAVADYVAHQLNITADHLQSYEWDGRTDRRHRKDIHAFLNVKLFDNIAKKRFRNWLLNDVLPTAPDESCLDDLVTDWLRQQNIDRPGGYRLERQIKSVKNEFENRLFQTIRSRLDAPTCDRLDGMLETTDRSAPFTELKSDIGPVSLESLLQAINRLEALRDIGLPQGILQGLNPKLVKRYRRRAATESAWDLKRHPENIRYPLMVFYCVPREAEIIDGLIDLMVQVVHKISARAEKRVVTELVKDIVKVKGKTNILFRIAEAVLEEPDGAVRDVVFPVASEQTIETLVKEFRASGPAYVKKIYTKIRSSYCAHYRRMLPRILDLLEFRSNNAAWRPILDAIDVIKAHQQSRSYFFQLDDVPIDSVVRNKWRGIVIEQAPDGIERINRINYEICVLQALREKLRCKEIWVVGAERFRNPDEDVPADYDTNRQGYYEALGWPVCADAFITQVKGDMERALWSLNASMPNSRKVKIKQRGKNTSISVTPLEAQLDPPNIEAVKREVGQRWSSTSLLDLLKETNFRVGFTQAFSSSANREIVEADEIQRRLLLTLYGLGTNAGLKRIASGRHGVSYKELLYTRRRYIHKDAMRDAIQRVVNGIFATRAPEVWGEATTACASDSTQFGAWDQNLMTEWHMRYGGRGVMIYWHVDEKSACIYSQLKRCSSSEVASMIEGVLHHCTEMEIDRHYVDTHGQSVVAFAFTHLLGFSLMPRFKSIDKQKLAMPEPGGKEQYPHLEAILTRPINWDLIRQQYDELIKFATALKERTAEPEAILRRFGRTNAQHPTYAALIELGKAIKTIFLCHYLEKEEVRREVHTGLNVIERWNGVNGFIYFGKGGEMATNKLEDQEISMLALHLLQVSLVYVNTLMLQQVLAEPVWRSRMTDRDMSALSPLIHAHINPYGIFELNMKERLPLAEARIAA